MYHFPRGLVDFDADGDGKVTMRPYRFVDYLLPILVKLFHDNGKRADLMMGNGAKPCFVGKHEFVEAALAPIRHVPHDAPVLQAFQLALSGILTLPPGVKGGSKAARAKAQVDLDRAVALLPPVWNAEDEWRDLQPNLAAVRRIQKFVKGWREQRATAKSTSSDDGLPTIEYLENMATDGR